MRGLPVFKHFQRVSYGENEGNMSEREKLAVRLAPEIRERLDRCYTLDGSKSRRQYIENAIQFYTDYLEMTSGSTLLPKEVSAAIDGRLGMFENRIASLLYKQTVEMDMVLNTVAGCVNLDEEYLQHQRARSIANVKQTNGRLSFESIVRGQGEE